MSMHICATLMALLIITSGTTASAEIRPPAVAGTFYPADPDELKAMVVSHLGGVGTIPEIDGRIVALIVPHAGLVYSGPIAAHAYKLLENRNIHSVIICGPAHRYPLRGISVYGPGVQWRTPLGTVPCNDGLCNTMINFNKSIQVIPAAHTQEHCLEVQLPYLQSVLSQFTITPLLVGPPDHATINLLAETLESLPVDDQTVLVASTDWQHYRPASEGRPMDSLGIDCLERLDIDRLQHYLETGQVEACGGGSILAVLKAAIAGGADRVKILKYGDSGDTFGDKSSVVGYVAAVLYDSSDPDKPTSTDRVDQTQKEATNMNKDDHDAQYLSADEKQQLLKIARETIESYLSGKGIPQFQVSGVLAENGAAFVTLEKQDRLRGCIGYTEAVMPLCQTVAQCAVSAAVEDPRFPPVTRNEVDQLHIEISVLTPLTKIETLDDIKVGRDGLMIVKGRYHGLLLPQVATDYGWNKTEFLQHTCQKAGLPPDAYKSTDATIYTFTALVFGEE